MKYIFNITNIIFFIFPIISKASSYFGLFDFSFGNFIILYFTLFMPGIYLMIIINNFKLNRSEFLISAFLLSIFFQFIFFILVILGSINIEQATMIYYYLCLFTFLYINIKLPDKIHIFNRHIIYVDLKYCFFIFFSIIGLSILSKYHIDGWDTHGHLSRIQYIINEGAISKNVGLFSFYTADSVYSFNFLYYYYAFISHLSNKTTAITNYIFINPHIMIISSIIIFSIFKSMVDINKRFFIIFIIYSIFIQILFHGYSAAVFFYLNKSFIMYLLYPILIFLTYKYSTMGKNNYILFLISYLLIIILNIHLQFIVEYYLSIPFLFLYKPINKLNLLNLFLPLLIIVPILFYRYSLSHDFFASMTSTYSLAYDRTIDFSNIFKFSNDIYLILSIKNIIFIICLFLLTFKIKSDFRFIILIFIIVPLFFAVNKFTYDILSNIGTKYLPIRFYNLARYDFLIPILISSYFFKLNRSIYYPIIITITIIISFFSYQKYVDYKVERFNILNIQKSKVYTKLKDSDGNNVLSNYLLADKFSSILPNTFFSGRFHLSSQAIINNYKYINIFKQNIGKKEIYKMFESNKISHIIIDRQSFREKEFENTIILKNDNTFKSISDLDNRYQIYKINHNNYYYDHKIDNKNFIFDISPDSPNTFDIQVLSDNDINSYLHWKYVSEIEIEVDNYFKNNFNNNITIKLHPKSGELDLNNSIYYTETEKSVGKRLDSNTYRFKLKNKSDKKKKLIIRTKPYKGIIISEIY
jgi:hypothetical protein